MVERDHCLTAATIVARAFALSKALPSIEKRTHGLTSEISPPY
jgi:hypothetical protein